MDSKTKLTPVLSANWDEKDSFTIAGYKRNGGYKAVTKALAMAPDEVIQMIKDSTLLNTDQKTTLLTQISSSQNKNLSSSEYNAKLNQVLKSCPQYDLSGLVSKKQASDVCYGCDTPK